MFLFKLARYVFHRPVREIEQMLDSREITEWRTYDKIDPIGNDRLDYLFSDLKHHILSMFVEKDIPWRDMLPPWVESEAQKQADKTGQMQQSILKSITLNKGDK
ncbi:MAG TPA: hypothetical protein ENG14_07015 [Thermodesulforhabdus norvegica]|uniref:Minor tail T domain-containing protein n=1 Tax=Thermodesulforhabdus norvegica TaxID=39841 RepID=A0A7C1AX55_9BACT|nr:hypothetical protein [Thermodesulforhabdus norvegica]